MGEAGVDVLIYWVSLNFSVDTLRLFALVMPLRSGNCRTMMAVEMPPTRF